MRSTEASGLARVKWWFDQVAWRIHKTVGFSWKGPAWISHFEIKKDYWRDALLFGCSDSPRPSGTNPWSTHGRFLVHEDDDLGPIGFLLLYVLNMKDWVSTQSGSCLRICSTQSGSCLRYEGGMHVGPWFVYRERRRRDGGGLEDAHSCSIPEAFQRDLCWRLFGSILCELAHSSSGRLPSSRFRNHPIYSSLCRLLILCLWHWQDTQDTLGRPGGSVC